MRVAGMSDPLRASLATILEADTPILNSDDSNTADTTSFLLPHGSVKW